ncbi:hypothetical protein, partial [Candidatus Hakubella thermalkaliphila]|uniref:hypothetical protein n=1 Tax=Candidatus Hakubella thermalkaliphila TaxID=2754717 RepID=UPI0015948941
GRGMGYRCGTGATVAFNMIPVSEVGGCGTFRSLSWPPTLWSAKRRVVLCPCCGVKVEELQWAEAYQRCTTRFA